SFPNLIDLDCSHNLNISIPSLPNSLLFFTCINSNLFNLPQLPSNLVDLNIVDNHVSFLPNGPNTLTHVAIINNDFNFNFLLPPNLEYLWCNNNQITAFSSLPNTLEFLDCSNNQLTTLPALPDSLTYLKCSSNSLTTLPFIPSKLSFIDCSSNFLLGTLPYLPNSVNSLECINCGLTSLTNLPDSIYTLNIYDNPNLKCLPLTNRIGNFYWGNTGITCLPDSITIVNSTPSIQNLPLCNWNNVNNCEIGKTIEGSIFKDDNMNCSLDTLEIKYPSIKVNLKKNGTLVQQTYTNQQGVFSFGTDGGTFEIAPDTTSPFYLVNCPVVPNYTVTIDSLNPLESDKDFSINCKLGFDLAATTVVSDSGVFRPGGFARVRAIAGANNLIASLNCAVGVSGMVKVLLQGPISFISASPSAIIPTISGDTLLYSITDFATVNAATSFCFVVRVDTAATANQQVCMSVLIDSIIGDLNFSNNNLTYCFAIVNSYDPNDKMVFPFGPIDSTQYWLTYSIRFQNTGNAPAQHIYILDTLDQNIIKSSFELLAYSHEPQMQIVGKRVRFNFPNINLPDSVNNEPESHGFVQYRVKRKNNLPIGTQIHNTAYIYFDFNPPVQTNTTLNEITVTSGVGVGENQNPISFSIFPNPISSGQILNFYFNSSEKKKAELSVYDLSGRKLFAQFVNASEQSQLVTLPSFSPGVYLMVLNDGKYQAQQKLVVLK
nr:T9SS type A sorting domain-containing protein [Bacteroidia bacterium]